jgi:hypothetical protein
MGQGASVTIRRRTVLTGAALAPSALLMACAPDAEPKTFEGGWIGAQVDRGHMLRDTKAGTLPAPQIQKRAGVIVLGAGIAGLGAARTLMRAGVDDIRVFDLEDIAGGNSRGHSMGGMGCPLGAHYLPTPGDKAVEVIELLEAFGLRRTERGQAVYDEVDLCHSPQERLYIAGHWHEGLLPPVAALPIAQRAETLAQYRKFSRLVESYTAGGAFAIPTARSTWSAKLDALDAIAFAPWLAAQGIDAPALRWHLDYCCRDDYGAGAAQVSAWAGLHYFASRHGFHAPGDAADDRDGGLLTWPEGNGWLSRKLAGPLGDRLQTGTVAMRVTENRHDVSVDVLNTRAGQIERWISPQIVMAMPLFISTRLLAAPNAALSECVARMQYAPWLVGNLQLDDALDDKPGAPPSWDNVFYESGVSGAMLGYVDAMHQSTRTLPGATVLTSYWALGGDSPERLKAQRARLLNEPWQSWAAQIVQDIARAHPDLPQKLRRIELMRYGHAMCIPTPGLRSGEALRSLAEPQRRVHFAHSDLSSYSVFEEALYHGVRAGNAAVRGLGV